MLDFDIFLSTSFAENMNSALPSNRILPYFEEVLVNALPLQNYGDFEWMFLEKSYVPLNSLKCILNLKKKISKKNILSFFSSPEPKAQR